MHITAMTARLIEQLLADYRSAKTSAHRLHIARDVAGRGVDATTAFSALVDDTDRSVSVAAAQHLLDFMQPDAAARERALLVIQRAAEQVVTPEAAGELAWLENWRAEQQNE